ncbi:hypothetical protein TSAR_010527 [Trichomalopsis sarcophagae]|uniref:Uncharacterized protein n=1 Tax=Trichomalopsis sarcophagae TaxID=543379 RepID=A0A232EKR3_9HYME|nr:hypothetical protein TSAR_010527 [Trichomalopsis sarcophagae]
MVLGLTTALMECELDPGAIEHVVLFYDSSVDEKQQQLRQAIGSNHQANEDKKKHKSWRQCVHVCEERNRER